MVGAEAMLPIYKYISIRAQTLTIIRAAGEGRWPCLIPLCHFHPLKNIIQTFICNFACEMWDDYYVFLIASFVATRLLLDEFYQCNELPFWLIDDAMFVSVCLLDELILDFCYSSFSLVTGGFELTSTITLSLQAKPTNQMR